MTWWGWLILGAVLFGAVVRDVFEIEAGDDVPPRGVEDLGDRVRSGIGCHDRSSLRAGGLAGGFQKGLAVTVRASGTGGEKSFAAVVRLDTPNEARYYQNGGILQYVLRQLLSG